MALWAHTKVAVRLLVITTVLLGLVYPLVVTGLAQVLFPRQAQGSLVWRDGRVVGSALLGQQFSRPGYFHPRPSAAGAGYDTLASGGSNLGPTSRVLAGQVRARVRRLAEENPGLQPGRVPADMATASASGLDPDISPANALAQAPRVARARGLPLADVQELVAANTTGRQLGLLGEPRVNVLRLNLALDAWRGR